MSFRSTLVVLVAFSFSHFMHGQIPQCCFDATCIYCWEVELCNSSVIDPETAFPGGCANCGQLETAGILPPCDSWTQNFYAGADEGCIPGCTDPTACNYTPNSNPFGNSQCEAGSDAIVFECDYASCAGDECSLIPLNTDSVLMATSLCTPLVDNIEATRSFDSSGVSFVSGRYGTEFDAIEIQQGGYLQFEDGILFAGERRQQYAVALWFKLNADTTQDYLFAGGTLVSGMTAIPNVPAGNVTTYWYQSSISLYVDQWMDEFYGNLSYSFGGSYVNIELAASDVPLNEWNHLVMNKGGHHVQTWLNGELMHVGEVYTGNYNGQINPNCTSWEDAPVYSVHGDSTSCWKSDDFYVENILTSQSNHTLYPSTNIVAEDLVISNRFLDPEEIAALADTVLGSNPTPGCIDPTACNFDPYATADDGSCAFTDNPYADCNGNCFFDSDGDGVCDQLEAGGCTDSTACNFDPTATEQTINCIPGGCMIPDACNYDPTANCDLGNCDFSCWPENELCGPGTHWDFELNMCVISIPTDVDLDHCTGVGDVLEVLANFGACNLDYVPYSLPCNNQSSIEYHGTEYPIVSIGSQCWFTLDLQTGQYATGDNIVTTGTGYGTGITWVEAMTGLHFGKYYNWLAVIDPRGLCPAGWDVPDDSDWRQLEEHLGMSAEESILFDWRGTNQGAELKASPTDVLPWDGTNSTGFGARTNGYIGASGGGSVSGSSALNLNSIAALYWSRTPVDDYDIILRQFQSGENRVKRITHPKFFGHAVRCVKD